jgi:hypothetical protein
MKYRSSEDAVQVTGSTKLRNSVFINFFGRRELWGTPLQSRL